MNSFQGLSAQKQTNELFWWKCELVFFQELEESLIWKLNTLSIKNFSIENTLDSFGEKKLFIWLPFDDWSEFDRDQLELSLCLLATVFNKKLGKFKWKKICDKDWGESWKKQWKPDPVGEKLLILPSWHDLPKAFSHRIVLRLDPGSAFGTGSHPTTRLCLEALERKPPSDLIVADVGCGSGILGIAAIFLGAIQVQAVDVDSFAVRATLHNASKNDLTDKQLIVNKGSIDVLENKMSTQKADLLICNILAPVIKNLCPHFSNVTKSDAHILLSGLLVDQVEEITTFLAQFNWNLCALYTQENWALIDLCKIPTESIH